MLVEWITIITVLLIVGILLDGWRRMRANQRGKIKMSRSMPVSKGGDADTFDVSSAELPSGGARVRPRSGDSADFEESLAPSFEPSYEPIFEEAPEQAALNLEEAVPMLMDVDTTKAADSIEDGELSLESAINSADVRIEPSFTAQTNISRELNSKNEPKIAAPEKAGPDDVIVINVMAPKNSRFNGQILMDVLVQCDMRFGDMDIFHRHEQPDGEGSVLFSMVNMIKPGTFSLSDMQSFETPGVSLFMTLPIESDPIVAFNKMATTAHELQKALGAELKDENRSVLTLQTLEHCRQRICEHQRKQRLAKRVAI